MNDQTAIEKQALEYEKKSDYQNGIPFCLQHLTVFPDSTALNTTLGYLYGDAGKASEGLKFADAALLQEPLNLRSRIAKAYLLNLDNHPCQALEILESCREEDNKDLNYLLQRSQILRNLGRSREALTDLQYVLKHQPSLAVARSNYLLYLHDIPGISAEDIFKAHLAYGQFCAPEYLAQKHRKPSIKGKINLGFVSADFRRHSVSYFLLPLIENLDSNEFSISLFSNNSKEDATTEKLKSLADNFINIRHLSDQSACEKITQQNIHILIDLSGHTAGNRLGIFALKPAPIQINWLGYPDTTGLSSMDYRISDPVADPVDSTFTTENLLRLPGGFLCYQPATTAPDITPAPFLKNNYITYGSFNNLAKTGPELLELWSEILKRTENSRLCLKSPSFSDQSGQEYIVNFFKSSDISSERIIFLTRSKTHYEHLESYNNIDIALDTFPYNGTTTTFEALYMGVPVITLKGQTHAQRVGASILEHLELNPLIASTATEYYNIAAALASQKNDLESLRSSLRQRLRNSQLCDGKLFSRRIMLLLKEITK